MLSSLRGEVMGQLEDEEGVVCGDIDLDFLDSVRKKIPVSHQRRCDVYSLAKLRESS